MAGSIFDTVRDVGADFHSQQYAALLRPTLLDAGGYRAAFTAEGPDETSAKVRIPPLEAIEIDLDLLFVRLE